ncbi:MAG: hypothetical protein JSW58_10970 [Candidatus Latescibacterota bacterium]|nr:MAG: hypothetical protein JSW58_10970 [Candidatus Latescibacterota bacterium]
MKTHVMRLVVLPVFCLLTLAGGCVYDDLTSEMVVTEKICVTLDEYRESGTLGSAVVCDQIADRVYKLLDKHNSKVKDIKSIGVISGTYRAARPSQADHDWTITSEVTIKRQDNPAGPVTDGPETFVNLTSQSLRAAQGGPIYADLNSDGVGLIARALGDLLLGEDPRLIVTMEGGTIDPEPTPADPLSFSWRVCVTFQVVIEKHLNK